MELLYNHCSAQADFRIDYLMEFSLHRTFYSTKQFENRHPSQMGKLADRAVEKMNCTDGSLLLCRDQYRKEVFILDNSLFLKSKISKKLKR